MDFFLFFWIFMIAAFLGDILETIFCYALTGEIMCRSSFLFGHFSAVWGAGAVLLTCLFCRRKWKRGFWLLLFGAIGGGVYEYGCSLLTELVYGVTFWDYSQFPLHIHGRVSLVICLFWGGAVFIWTKWFYPLLEKTIRKWKTAKGKTITWVVLTIMVINSWISIFALLRYGERIKGEMADSSLERWLDENYPEKYMNEIYPDIQTKKISNKGLFHKEI